MRLIDADELRKQLDEGVWNDAVAEVDAQPTIEAVPVVHGEWEECDLVEYDEHGECVHHPEEGIRCSNCCNAFKKELLWKHNFCPNCGAKMEGGAE